MTFDNKMKKKSIVFMVAILGVAAIISFCTGCAALNYQHAALYIGRSYTYEPLGRSCPILRACERRWTIPLLVSIHTEKDPYTLEILVTSPDPPAPRSKEYFEVEKIVYNTTRRGDISVSSHEGWQSESFHKYSTGSEARCTVPVEIEVDPEKDDQVYIKATLTVYKSGETRKLIVEDKLKLWTRKGLIPWAVTLWGDT